MIHAYAKTLEQVFPCFSGSGNCRIFQRLAAVTDIVLPFILDLLSREIRPISHSVLHAI